MENIDQSELLAHVPPHVRAKMLKRVEVLRRYVRDKCRASAERGAAELGLSMVHFKKLAYLWELHGRVDRLPGSEWPKTKSIATTEQQMACLREAVDALPAATAAKVAKHAAELAARKGIKLQGRNTVHMRITELRKEKALARCFGINGDLVVVHAALNLPIEVDGCVAMPIAALAVHPITRTVLGVGLAGDGINARSAAQALTQALGRLPVSSAETASQGPLRIAIDTLPGADWQALRATLEEAGAVVEGKQRKIPRRDIAVTYLGHKVGGIAIHPRFVVTEPGEREPYIASGQKCLSLKEAWEFATARMVPEVKPSASGEAAHRLVEHLTRWLKASDGSA